MAYTSVYRPENKEKYLGDPNNVIARSMWERSLMKWLDHSSVVAKWGSERIIVDYHCMTDHRMHKYYVDFVVVFENNKTVLIEVKPKRQTEPPKLPKKMSKTYLTEVLTYGKNISKWEAAKRYAKSQGWEFQIFTEDTFREMGINIILKHK